MSAKQLEASKLLPATDDGSIIGVVESQKRGLPHIHIVLIVKNKSGQLTEQEIDKLICAEIPDETKTSKFI